MNKIETQENRTAVNNVIEVLNGLSFEYAFLILDEVDRLLIKEMSEHII